MAAIASAWIAAPVLHAQEPASVLEEVVVTAQLRTSSLSDVPASIAILDHADIREAAVQHFEELTQLVPNLNWAGGSSRPRYFQIRGIGERSQYEGAPNPSVGFLVDDIDFSALGGIATLFDTDRIEVLRGPQGTRYGANALAGLVYVRSREPTDSFEAIAEATAGSHDTMGGGLAFGGPVSGTALTYRLAAHKYESDGFRQNAWRREATAARDESMLRGKLRWQGADGWQLDATAFYADLDNGYDHWSVDNGLVTYSDRPGEDDQRSLAAAVVVHREPADTVSFSSITSVARSDITFSFDADWGNADFWSPYVYDFFSSTLRDRETASQEFRFQSPAGQGAFGGRVDWTAGIYAQRLRESNLRRDEGVYDDFFFPAFVVDDRVASEYEARTYALFGEVDIALSPAWSLRAGLRSERRDADYGDSTGNDFRPGDDMLGGQLAISWQVADNVTVYASAARGYKAGGFNLGFAGRPDVSDAELLYEPEFLWNWEAGVRAAWPAHGLRAELTLFHSRRRDVQIETSTQLNPNDPTTFIFFTDNAGSGTNSGVEAVLSWHPSDRLEFDAAIGLLDTEVDDAGSNAALEGRRQAHAPRYSYSLAATWRSPGGWMARIDAAGKAAFYYSDSHDQQSRPYVLLGLRAGYETERWSVHVWVRNLLDEPYTVRGFFFGNEPPDFPSTRYTRLGDPRHAGVTLRFRF
jgi:outer membrane receptor protein involved in Fe transport